jgi:hypothetical protein
MIITLNNHGSYEIFTDILTTIMGNSLGTSLLDLCCNEATVTGKLPFNKKIFVDIEPRTLLYNQQKNFVETDALSDHTIFNDNYEVVTCLDGIEHVTREQGWKLIERMKKLGNKSIIFTPLDAWMMEVEGSERYLNDPKCHKSLWNPNDLPDWAHIVMPKYHPTLNIGAFFSWYCSDLEQDFIRVKNAINSFDMSKYPN